MDTSNPPPRRRGLASATGGQSSFVALAGRRNVMMLTTVMVVLALAAWAIIGFYGDRPSPLPRVGNPMPALPALAANSALEAELAQVTATLARRNSDDELLVEAVYHTPELFALLSRSEAALQDNVDAESLFETYLREHDLGRHLVFTLILSQDSPDLGKYRPAEMIHLRTDDGRKLPALSWVEAPNVMPNSTRAGMLHFPRPTQDNLPMLSENEGWFELVVSGLGEEDQILRWELPIAYPSA